MNGATPEQSIQVAIEHLDPAMVGVGPRGLDESSLLAVCARAMADNVLDPSMSRLVVTADFVASVRARATDPHYAKAYNTQRNSGTVGGKTMTMPDGSFDVLLPAHLFLAEIEATDTAKVTFIALRTVMHEAQHVAMGQAGEASTDHAGNSWARRNFLVSADQVIDEYRAEAALDATLRWEEGAWDLIEVLYSWLASLYRITCVEYQEHLDVRKFAYGVGQESHTAWKLLAYVVAAAPVEASPEQIAGDEVIQHPIWSLMVGDHWRPFVAELRAIPNGSIRVSRSRIEGHVSRLADLLYAWLRSLGYESKDILAGSQFQVLDWSLMRQAELLLSD